MGLGRPGAKRSCLTVYVGPPRGGCHQRLVRLSGALLDRGWTVHFAGHRPPLESHEHLVFHQVPARRLSLAALVEACQVAAGAVRRQRVPLVWTFGAAYSAPLAPLLWGSRARLVTFLRGSLVEQERARRSGPLRRALAGLAERAAVAGSDRLVAVSRAVAARSAPGAEVLPNEVAGAPAPCDPATARRALSLPPDAFVAAYAGAIAPIKSLETLLEAARVLPGLHVALMGFSAAGTAHERELRARAAALAGRAHLLEWGGDVPALIAAADVVVLPSRDEGCPNLLLEALAQGRPVLGARCAGIEEVLAEEALLFPPGDAGGLAGRLGPLMESPRAREEAAAASRRRAEGYRFDWEARAVSVLERALEER